MRKKIAFDCDGVIAEGGWVDVANRTNTYYFKKLPLNDEVVPSLEWLSTLYDIYIISTRSHEDSNLGLRAWFHFGLRLEMDTIAGVITYPDFELTADHHKLPMDKASVIRSLGIAVHFDDDPFHIQACPGRAVLFPSEMPVSQEAINRVPTVMDWDGIRTFLTTPGMTLYGSDGASVVSPAVVDKKYPQLKSSEVVM